MTKQVVLSLFIFTILLLSCSGNKPEGSGDQPLLNSDQVIEKLHQNGINLKEKPRNHDPYYIFHRMINGVEPKIYTNDQSMSLVLYVFSSSEEMSEGKEIFYDIPAEFVEHLTFEINNILIFCLGFDENLKAKMKIVVSELKEAADKR